jgi:copper(I)-binding protein
MSLRSVGLTAGLIILLAISTAAQRAVKASDAWVRASSAGEALAGVILENGTMYDAYLTGVESDAAQAVELLQTTNGKPAVVKEVAIPAFDRVAMVADGVFLRLKGLKKPLRPGNNVSLTMTLDSGERLNIDATVK